MKVLEDSQELTKGTDTCTWQRFALGILVPLSHKLTFPCNTAGSTSEGRAMGGAIPSGGGSLLVAQAWPPVRSSLPLPADPPLHPHSWCHQRGWKFDWQRLLCPKRQWSPFAGDEVAFF